jgi:hypothetical protein
MLRFPTNRTLSHRTCLSLTCHLEQACALWQYHVVSEKGVQSECVCTAIVVSGVETRNVYLYLKTWYHRLSSTTPTFQTPIK